MEHQQKRQKTEKTVFPEEYFLDLLKRDKRILNIQHYGIKSENHLSYAHIVKPINEPREALGLIASWETVLGCQDRSTYDIRQKADGKWTLYAFIPVFGREMWKVVHSIIKGAFITLSPTLVPPSITSFPTKSEPLTDVE